MRKIISFMHISLDGFVLRIPPLQKSETVGGKILEQYTFIKHLLIMIQHLAKTIIFISVIFSLSSSANSQTFATENNDSIPTGVISFLTTRDGNFEVYTMTADGKNVTNLTNNNALDFWSSWSPDSKYILFYSNRDGNNEIYRMDADGKNQINLSNHPSNDYLPCWSPDGKKIVFTSDRDNKKREIYTMNADGSDIIRVTINDFFEEVPTWSIDGSKILFTKQIKEPEDTSHAANGEIFIMDTDGKNEKRLTFKKGYDSGAKFSPDGKRIAFYGPTEEKNFEIFLMNSDGSNIINLTNDILEDYSPSWSPDGKWIAYSSGTSAQYDVWLINVETRKKIRLTTEPKRNETPVWRPN